MADDPAASAPVRCTLVSQWPWTSIERKNSRLCGCKGLEASPLQRFRQKELLTVDEHNLMAKRGHLTKAHLTEVLNDIVQQVGLPILYEKKFAPSPFLENWYGKDNLNDYVYSLFRINERCELEHLNIDVSKQNQRIDLFINAFLLRPRITSLNDLNGKSIFPFILPPNSLSQIQLSKDEFGKIPLLRLLQAENLVMGVPRNEIELGRRIERLSTTMKRICTNVDESFVRWHKRYKVRTMDWNGAPLAS
jgi:hypothetical protein